MRSESSYSKCGFECRRCPAFRENSKTPADSQKGRDAWEKYFGLHFKPELIQCEGCQSPDPWKGGNQLPERGCQVRACAVHNKISNCAYCSVFPCSEYTRKVPGSDLRQKREKAAGCQFSDHEYLQFIEPFEGSVHLQKLRASLSEADLVCPRPVVPENRIVPFPEKLTLSQPQSGSMQKLYTLLSGVFSRRAGTYADQVILERHKPYQLGILWVMALYGELRNGILVLNSAGCQDKKECTRLVRKTDNNLHGAIQEAADTLAEYGIKVDFTPDRKNWELSLSIRGGLASSLKEYVTALVKSCGESRYVNGYKLQGESYRRFTRLDMRCFS